MIYKTILNVPLPVINDPYACHIRACEAVDSDRSAARMVFHPTRIAGQGSIVLFTPEPVNETSTLFQPKKPYWFVTRLNPSKKLDGKIVPLLEKAEIEEFVRRKLAPFNVIPETLRISDRYAVKFTKQEGRKVTINTVAVMGEIQELPEDFETLLLAGVGREKAFGYGVLYLY